MFKVPPPHDCFRLDTTLKRRAAIAVSVRVTLALRISNSAHVSEIGRFPSGPLIHPVGRARMSPLPQQGERISPSTSQARLYLRRIYDYGAARPRSSSRSSARSQSRARSNKTPKTAEHANGYQGPERHGLCLPTAVHQRDQRQDTTDSRCCTKSACGRLARAGSGSHSGVELWRSKTGKGSSGGRKKRVV